jgi:hypothetical protein
MSRRSDVSKAQGSHGLIVFSSNAGVLDRGLNFAIPSRVIHYSNLHVHAQNALCCGAHTKKYNLHPIYLLNHEV